MMLNTKRHPKYLWLEPVGVLESWRPTLKHMVTYDVQKRVND